MSVGFDELYPVSETMQNTGSPFWQIQMDAKLSGHLANAKNGDRNSESKLVNRLGQMRRNVPTLSLLNESLADTVKECVDWVRTTGRKVDFANQDPRYWITARDGKTPRW